MQTSSLADSLGRPSLHYADKALSCLATLGGSCLHRGGSWRPGVPSLVGAIRKIERKFGGGYPLYTSKYPPMLSIKYFADKQNFTKINNGWGEVVTNVIQEIIFLVKSKALIYIFMQKKLKSFD